MESTEAERRARREFAELVGVGGEIPLDRAAFLLSAALGGHVIDVAEQSRRLDDLAAGVRESTVEAVAEHLFGGPGGFVGDRNDYRNPDNSRLDRVLDRRRGIPISLSVLMIEVARRCDVRLVGVGMPGHFLVGVPGATGRVRSFVDAFGGGRALDVDGCRDLMRSMAGPGVGFDERWLAPTHSMAIIERMTNNLKAIHLAAGDVASLRKVMTLRSAIPGLGRAESDEFARAMAILN